MEYKHYYSASANGISLDEVKRIQSQNEEGTPILITQEATREKLWSNLDPVPSQNRSLLPKVKRNSPFFRRFGGE